MKKSQNPTKSKKLEDKDDVFPTAHAEDFPTRRALEELNEMTRGHYVTKHGGGTQTDSQKSSAVGPMDHEA